MAQIQCEKCDKPIDVPNAKIGQKVTCPACGDVNVIRALDAPASAARVDRAAEAGYPSALGPEVDVMMVRPAMFRANPARFIFVCLLIVGCEAAAVYFLVMATPNQLLAIVCAGASIIPILYLIFWKVRTLGEGLKITTKRTIDQHGLFSKDTSDVLHVDIKNIQIKQSFMDRIWGVGQIALSSSAEHEEEIVIHDVPNPEKVRQVIDLYRNL